MNDRRCPDRLDRPSVAPLERAMTRPKAVQVETPGPFTYIYIYITLMLLQFEMARSKSWLGFLWFGSRLPIPVCPLWSWFALVVLYPSLVSSSSATIFLWLLGSVQWSRCNPGTDRPSEFLPSFDLPSRPFVPNSRRSVKESNATMSRDIRFVHSNTCGRM